MSLEKEIVPKGDYHSSLEVIVENSYATSAGKLVSTSKAVISIGNLAQTSLRLTRYLMPLLSEKNLSVNIKKISNSFTVFW